MNASYKKKAPPGLKDPVELCGSTFRSLVEEGGDLNQHREFLRELVRKYGADWVWANRGRLVALVMPLFAPSMN